MSTFWMKDTSSGTMDSTICVYNILQANILCIGLGKNDIR